MSDSGSDSRPPDENQPGGAKSTRWPPIRRSVVAAWGGPGRARRIVRARSNDGDDSEGRDRARRARLCEEVEGRARPRARAEPARGAVIGAPRAEVAIVPREVEGGGTNRGDAAERARRGAGPRAARGNRARGESRGRDVDGVHRLGGRARRESAERPPQIESNVVRAWVFAFRGAEITGSFLDRRVAPVRRVSVKASSGPAARSTSRTRHRLLRRKRRPPPSAPRRRATSHALVARPAPITSTCSCPSSAASCACACSSSSPS